MNTNNMSLPKMGGFGAAGLAICSLLLSWTLVALFFIIAVVCFFSDRQERSFILRTAPQLIVREGLNQSPNRSHSLGRPDSSSLMSPIANHHGALPRTSSALSNQSFIGNSPSSIFAKYASPNFNNSPSASSDLRSGFPPNRTAPDWIRLDDRARTQGSSYTPATPAPNGIIRRGGPNSILKQQQDKNKTLEHSGFKFRKGLSSLTSSTPSSHHSNALPSNASLAPTNVFTNPFTSSSKASSSSVSHQQATTSKNIASNTTYSSPISELVQMGRDRLSMPSTSSNRDYDPGVSEILREVRQTVSPKRRHADESGSSGEESMLHANYSSSTNYLKDKRFRSGPGGELSAQEEAHRPTASSHQLQASSSVSAVKRNHPDDPIQVVPTGVVGTKRRINEYTASYLTNPRYSRLSWCHTSVANKSTKARRYLLDSARRAAAEQAEEEDQNVKKAKRQKVVEEDTPEKQSDQLTTTVVPVTLKTNVNKAAIREEDKVDTAAHDMSDSEDLDNDEDDEQQDKNQEEEDEEEEKRAENPVHSLEAFERDTAKQKQRLNTMLTNLAKAHGTPLPKPSINPSSVATNSSPAPSTSSSTVPTVLESFSVPTAVAAPIISSTAQSSSPFNSHQAASSSKPFSPIIQDKSMDSDLETSLLPKGVQEINDEPEPHNSFGLSKSAVDKPAAVVFGSSNVTKTSSNTSTPTATTTSSQPTAPTFSFGAPTSSTALPNFSAPTVTSSAPAAAAVVPPFSFGGFNTQSTTTADKSDAKKSDSTPATAAAAPLFQFGGLTSTTSTDAQKKDAPAPAAPVFAFGQTAAAVAPATTTAAPEAPKWSFGAAVTSSATKPADSATNAFTLGNNNPTLNGLMNQASKPPAFQFGNALPTTSASSTGSLFNTADTAKKDTPAAPIFAFGQTTAAPAAEVKPAQAPTFQFGNVNSATSTAGSTLSAFGSVDSTKKDASSVPAPIFAFGQQTAPAPAAEAPKWSFNATTPSLKQADSTANAFTLNNNNNTAPNGLIKSVGAQPPAFQFGNASATPSVSSAAPPAFNPTGLNFNFSATPTAGATPFGAPTLTPAPTPTFQFGTGMPALGAGLSPSTAATMNGTGGGVARRNDRRYMTAKRRTAGGAPRR